MNISGRGSHPPAQRTGHHTSSAHNQPVGNSAQPLTDPRLQGETHLQGPRSLFPGVNFSRNIHSSHASANPLRLEISQRWAERLSADAVEDLNTGILHNGLAHAAWGSKPMFYLESADQSGCWPHFATALNSGMKNGFALIPSADNANNEPDNHEGYLLNIANALQSVNDNKAIFAQRFGLSEQSDSGEILQNHVFPLLAGKHPESETELTAILLGYGHQNAHAYTEMNGDDPQKSQQIRQQNHALDARVAQQMEAIMQEKGASVPLPGIPSFIKTDTPATKALLDTYINESSHIQEGMADLFSRYDDDTEESLENEPRLLAAALMRKMCNDPA